MASLEIKSLSAGYGGSMVFQGIDMEAAGGKITALLGSNGAGKTTLLKSLMGILPLRSGSIFWDGESVLRKAPFERARLGFGYVPQGRDIFPFLSVRENLLLGLEARGRKPCAEDLAYAAMYFPEIEAWFDRKGSDLSGGQQQILAFARILLCKPKLLLLDEPTEGIQPSIVKQIGKTLARLRDEAGMTVVLVEQFVDFALDLADYYYLMEHGEFTRFGPVNNENRNEIKGTIKI